jgi:hypothetical protein
MSIRFADPGGRAYTAAGTSGVNILAHWSSSINITSWAVSSGNGRSGGASLRSTTQNSGLIKTLDNQQTWGVAFAVRMAGFGNPMGILLITDAGTPQIGLISNLDGSISVHRSPQFNSPGTVLATSSKAMRLNTWVHIEFKVKIDPSTGTYELRFDGVPIIGPITSANTRGTSNSTANGIVIGLINNSSMVPDNRQIDYDDIIVWDGTTTDAQGNADVHDFIGDTGLAVSRPSGAGTTTNFTPDSGSNYARVNETTPDGDTSYVESSTVTNIDTYAMDDLPSGASAVKFVGGMHYAKKTDVGARGIKAELRTSSTNYSHATELALSNSYQYYQSFWGQNPNTTAAWSVSEVNAIESGQNVSS